MENHKYTIHVQGEFYKIDDQCHISRACMNWKASGQWKALALIRYNNNGTIKENIPFAEWPKHKAHFDETRIFGNGKAQWHLMDLDHGTRRIWGAAITNLYFINP